LVFLWPGQARPEGVGGCLDPVFQVELLQDVLQMVLDGVLGDPKGRANLFVRRSCRQKLQDLQLPGAELLFRTGLLTVGPGHTGELVENLGGRRPGDWGLPMEDPAENPQEGFWLDL